MSDAMLADILRRFLEGEGYSALVPRRQDMKSACHHTSLTAIRFLRLHDRTTQRWWSYRCNDCGAKIERLTAVSLSDALDV